MRTRVGFAKSAAGIAFMLTVLVGCSSPLGGSGSSGFDAEPGVPAIQEMEYAADSQAYAPAMDGAVPGVIDPAQQALIVTGDASVKVDDVPAAVDQFTATIADLGGVVSTSSISQSGANPSATVVARVPADDFPALMDSLGNLGEILRSSTNTEDVGQQLADLDARISALETSIERLTELIAEATTTADLLQAEEMLTYRQADLDSLNGQREYLSDQVAMSTLTAYFTTTTTSPGPSGSFSEGWEYFLRSVVNLFYTVMWLLPWLILGALILTPVLMWRRRKVRARREAAPVVVAPAVTPAGPPAASPAVAPEESASDRLVHDGAERGGIVREPAEEEAVDGEAEPGEEAGAR